MSTYYLEPDRKKRSKKPWILLFVGVVLFFIGTTYWNQEKQTTTSDGLIEIEINSSFKNIKTVNNPLIANDVSLPTKPKVEIDKFKSVISPNKELEEGPSELDTINN